MNENIHENQSPQVPAKDKQGEARYGAAREVWSEKMLEALERGVKGNVWFSLIDKVYKMTTLELAWEKVQSNAGACGIDGITVEHFEKDNGNRLLVVNEQLKEGSYTPKPVKRVWIAKGNRGEKRPLGIPTVKDRVVQTAVRMVIEPIFEKEFAEHSYGFRPGRGCKQALKRVDELLKDGYTQIVDIDVKGYFDTIPHAELMKLVCERIADGRVIKLIEGFLKQGVMEEMGNVVREEHDEGTPQGGVISPLLANIYLNPLDWLMHQNEIEMVRYADDMVVLCKDKIKAQHALELLNTWMEQAKLTLHPEKTKQVDMDQTGAHFDFLGIRFWCAKNGKVKRFIRPKSTKKLKERIKPLTRRANGKSMDAIIAKLNPILRGVYNYFKHVNRDSLKRTDGWVRNRLRGILRKRRHGKGRGRGLDHQRWCNRYFTDLNLFSLEQAYEAEIFSLHGGEKC